MSAVTELLEEGAFHEATVEEVARRAGIARATLYQHFRSRLDLVDAICDKFDVNPALVELRQAIDLPDVGRALDEMISLTVRFWESEDLVLHQLYGVAAVDPAAHDLVERQRVDRRGEVERLARRLRNTRGLRLKVSERRAVDVLMVLTSYETFKELQRRGLGGTDSTKLLRESARTLLLS
jgi:AcrR family transcriptional regulator